MKSIFRIADINLGLSRWDVSYNFEIFGTRFEVERFGANLSIDNVKRLIQSMGHQVDAIALSSLPPTIDLGGRTYLHRQNLEIFRVPSAVPLCSGETVAALSNMNGLIKKIEDGTITPEKGIFFPSGFLSLDAVNVLADKYSKYLYYGDAFCTTRIPVVTRHFKGIRTLARLGMTIANAKQLKSNTYLDCGDVLGRSFRQTLVSQLKNIQYIYSRPGFLLLFGDDLEFIRGKDLILPYGHEFMENELKKFSPKSVIHLFPREFAVSPYLNYPVLDAAMRLQRGHTTELSLRQWEDLLSTRTDINFKARRYVWGKKKESFQTKVTKKISAARGKTAGRTKPDFAFIVHALSHRDLARAPALNFLNHLPKSWDGTIESGLSRLPGFKFGEIRNVISRRTGKATNGIIYALPSTPTVMKKESPEIVYRKIERICHDAARRGAKIIGLGAYTKVVGDSGETINRLSPIPVTTGNSLSASATLWAVYDVVKKMELLRLDPNTKKVEGSATVIGATGSIGRVSAKLMGLVFKELNLVAPRKERLQELAQEISEIAPDTKVNISTDANDFANKTDVLVTATSAFDQKIIDVDQLKPGCVVCDCSRPLDFSIEDARRRPDILIIESGEVILPGPYTMTCDLGLPERTVYACLGETAILSMEEKFESFTLGRDLDWHKVKDIYRMAREHGVELAAIRGHAGFINPREIQLVKDLAIKKRRPIIHSPLDKTSPLRVTT